MIFKINAEDKTVSITMEENDMRCIGTEVMGVLKENFDNFQELTETKLDMLFSILTIEAFLNGVVSRKKGKSE